MPIYHQLGIIPEKRHVVSRQPNGALYQEELVGTQGFAGVSSLVYHLYPPTRVKQKDKPYSVKPRIAVENSLDAMSFQGFQLPQEDDY
ncbi:MAG TPA: homogentisate 1,2-dioxygenase, partial [Chitinophagaceae bacterium]|nr:homogentisate 1,2-dioxygenase [Chitinophagaceae bacterium]